MRAVEYVLGHREEPPAPGLLVLRPDFGAEAPPAPGPEPPPADWVEQITAICAEVQRLVQVAQEHRPAWDAPYMAYQAAMAQILDQDIGPIHDYMAQILALLPKAGPVPGPQPPPEPQPPGPFRAPVPHGGIYGRTKWLPGSTGVDIFVPRGTEVQAPAPCEVVWAQGGTGRAGGAEVIVTLPDRRWAWRWRHVQPRVRVGTRLEAGQVAAVVDDPSLDQLCPEPVRHMPDGWQHLDLSVNAGTDRFDPTGGGGGNVSAVRWLEEEAAYVGTVLARTPGPTDCGLRLAEAQAWLAGRGR